MVKQYLIFKNEVVARLVGEVIEIWLPRCPQKATKQQASGLKMTAKATS